MRIAPEIILSEAEHAELRALACSDAGPANPRLALRAQIILLAAQGIQNKEIATHLGIGRVQVARWRDRYAQLGLAGIEHDLPRGAPPVHVDVERLLELTEGHTRLRSVAAMHGVSAGGAPMARISGRPMEIVGLYVAAGERALALACETRGTPSLPLSGQGASMRQHLAASFMTALQLLDAETAGLPVPTQMQAAADWLGFLQALESGTPTSAAVRVLTDNVTARQHPDVREWLARNPRITVQSVPDSAAWQRMVQQQMRDAPGGLPAGMLQALAFMSEPACWPLRWIHRRSEAEPVSVPAAPPQVVRNQAERLSFEGRHAVGMLPTEALVPGLAHPVAGDKVAPPRQGRQLFVRETLMARLLEARRQRCIIVQGQAGSGKTSALVAWRKALIPLGFDVCWLALSPEENEPSRFFRCLVASLADVCPEVVGDAGAVLGGDCEAGAVEHWVITLVQALAQRKRDLVLMIDDVHHVTDTRIVQALQWLLAYAPSQLHLAFASRTALPLALERLRAQDAVTEFDMRDLRFTRDESERFLRAQLGTIEPHDAEAIHELTDGWVAGLQLFAVDLRVRRGAGYPVVPVRDARSFVSYFDREVLGRLADTDLDMLMRMAICQRFCVTLCAAMLGRPEAEIGARLARLEADNLFLSQVRDQEHAPWYRMHPLMRETLLERLRQVPDVERQALHTAAWQWFQAHGNLDDAVLHAVQGHDDAAAAGMVEKFGRVLLVRGELSRLSALLRMLSPEQVRSRFGLLVVQAYVQLYARDLGGLRRSLDQLAVHEAAAAPASRYTLHLLRAGLALQADDTATVREMLPQLRDIPTDADDLAWSSRGNALSWFYLLAGDFDGVRRLQEETACRTSAPRSSLFGRYIAAASVAREGQIEQAGKLVRDVLRESERQGPEYAGLACLAAGLLADLLYESNDAKAACRLLEPRIGVLERVSLPDVVLRAMTVLSNAFWQVGRRAEAIAALDRLEAYAVRFSLDRVLAEALVLRLRRHVQQGETERANTVLDCVMALDVRHATGAWGDKIRRAASLGRIEVAMYMQDYAAAAALLDGMGADAAGGHARTASLALRVALAQQMLGNEAKARDVFVSAVRLGHDAGLARSLLDAAASAPVAFAKLIQMPLPDPVLTYYVDRLAAAFDDGTGDACVPSASVCLPAAQLSARENEILSLLAQAMSNKKIASVLNLSPETVKWHLKNIYTKLGVSGRGGAAARMRDFAACEPVRQAA